MEQTTITKKAREVGTSAGVLLPRSWLNRQVVVTLFEPSREKILHEVMSCLLDNGLNEEAKGIYLFGSYARGDYDTGSDIDVLVLTENVNKIINRENYEILLVSESSFSKNLPNSLNYLSILKEAKVILNKGLIEKYRAKKRKPNAKGLLPEIWKVLRINKEAVETCKEHGMNVPDGIAYSLVLRLRELYIIKYLLSGKAYHKEDFLKIAGEKAYSAYLRVKRNNKEMNVLSADELKSILELSEKWLKELKG